MLMSSKICNAVLFVTILGTSHAMAQGVLRKTTASILVPPQSHGVIVRRVNGLDWNPKDGKLYATSTMGEVIYRIDPKTGDVDIAVPAPDGEGDDVAIAPDGSMAWTAIATGELRYKKPGGPVQILDKDLPGANPVAFRKDGRLVAAQANIGTALYEYDPAGKKPRRLILQEKADLNSFGFGPDGLLYSPQRGGKMVSVNIDTGELRVIAEGIGGGVRSDAKGHLISISQTGNFTRTDPKTGKTEILGPVSGGIDGLSVGPDGTIYASSPSESSVFAVDPVTGAVRDVVRGRFSSLGGLAMAKQDGKEILLAADAWGFRNVDPLSGEVTKIPTRGLRTGGSSDIAIDATGIAVSNVRLGTVQKIDRASEKMIFESKELKQPYGVALLDDGAIAVADFTGQRIARVDATGATTIAAGFAGPVGLTRGKAGELLVSDAVAGTISRVDLKNGQITEVVRGLRQPEGLAMMTDSRLAVAETGASRLIAIDLQSNAREILADKLPFGAHVTQTAEKIGLPAGVAVGGDGAIYVSCDGDYSIRKVTLAAAK